MDALASSLHHPQTAALRNLLVKRIRLVGVNSSARLLLLDKAEGLGLGMVGERVLVHGRNQFGCVIQSRVVVPRPMTELLRPPFLSRRRGLLLIVEATLLSQAGEVFALDRVYGLLGSGSLLLGD